MGASIHPSAFIAPLVFIDPVYPKGVKIREDVIIGFRTMIVTHYISWDRAEGRFRLITGDVELEAGCFVGAEATVQPGCRVSSGTVIGERALVKIGTTCDGGVWVGVPAKRRD